MQVELVMLDPYVRAPLAADGNGTFTARFRAPDVYGVFKWVLDYQRRGLSRLHVTETVPIRPYFHNEYERFIFQVRVALGRERGQLLHRRHSGSRMPIPCALDPANRSQTHPLGPPRNLPPFAHRRRRSPTMAASWVSWPPSLC